MEIVTIITEIHYFILCLDYIFYEYNNIHLKYLILKYMKLKLSNPNLFKFKIKIYEINLLLTNMYFILISIK